MPAQSGLGTAGRDTGVDRTREPVQREHGLHGHEPGQGAVDDLTPFKVFVSS